MSKWNEKKKKKGQKKEKNKKKKKISWSYQPLTTEKIYKATIESMEKLKENEYTNVFKILEIDDFELKENFEIDGN